MAKKTSKRPKRGAQAPPEVNHSTSGRRPVARVAVILVALFAAASAWYALRSPVDHDAPVAAHDAAKLVAAGARFVGTLVCAECHRGEYDRWKTSHHAHAMAAANAETVLGDFRNQSFRYNGVTSSFSQREGKYFVRTDGPDGTLAEYEVKYTFGYTPLQQYLVELEGGRMQVLPFAWDTRPAAAGGGRWFHLYPEERLDFRSELHWTGPQQNWNFMCADCHSTGVRKNFEASSNTYRTAYAEVNVACEACHGPGSRHVDWARQTRTGKRPADSMKGLEVTFNERRGVSWPVDRESGKPQRSVPRTTDIELGVCAQCHARRAPIADGYTAGKRFLDYYVPVLLGEPLYYPDGQQRAEVFNWGSFVQSRMYRHGVTCSDCHEPHTQKLRALGNAVCAQCHVARKYDTSEHHFHAPASEGAQCVSCHMPPKNYMIIDARRDHSMRVPQPDVTLATGAPNACNTCHRDRDARWALDEIVERKGHVERGYQQFARALNFGSGLSGEDIKRLAGLVSSDQPAIARATGAEALARSGTGEAEASGLTGLRDPDALVRRASLATLEGRPHADQLKLGASLLGDPVRAVRIEAARVLAGVPPSAMTPVARAAFDKAAFEYVESERFNADRAVSHINLGNFFFAQGREKDAEDAFRRAVSQEPSLAAAYVNLADFLRSTAREADAQGVLRNGLERAPADATLNHAFGLALVRARRHAEAIAYLERAAKLAPANARYGFVCAIALHSMGKSEAALAMLDTVLTRHPDDRESLLAAASIRHETGDAVGARLYGRRFATAFPDDPRAEAFRP